MHSQREIEYESLLDYCKAVRKNFEGLKDENQAILEISSVVTGISRLDPALRPMVSGGPPPRCKQIRQSSGTPSN
jgi:endoribonuclease Dicer